MIPTVDAISLIKKHLAQTVRHYPEGSLSPRTVLASLPVKGDPEAFARKIDAIVTREIFKRVEKEMKSAKVSNLGKFKDPYEVQKDLENLSGRVCSAVQALE